MMKGARNHEEVLERAFPNINFGQWRSMLSMDTIPQREEPMGEKYNQRLEQIVGLSNNFKLSWRDTFALFLASYADLQYLMNIEIFNEFCKSFEYFWMKDLKPYQYIPWEINTSMNCRRAVNAINDCLSEEGFLFKVNIIESWMSNREEVVVHDDPISGWMNHPYRFRLVRI